MVDYVLIKERQSPSTYHKSYINYLEKNMETLISMIKMTITEVHSHNGTYLFYDGVKKKINLVIEIP